VKKTARWREIAQITGWSHPTIINDLKAVKSDQKAVNYDQPKKSSTTGAHSVRAERAARLSVSGRFLSVFGQLQIGNGENP
jgi:hypothetical protein